jgi:hypothetical protein
MSIIQAINTTPILLKLGEVCYLWHPWYGRKVKVHATLVRHGVAVARCSSEDVHPRRTLELPLWMLDSTVCRRVQVAKPGRVAQNWMNLTKAATSLGVSPRSSRIESDLIQKNGNPTDVFGNVGAGMPSINLLM